MRAMQHADFGISMAAANGAAIRCSLGAMVLACGMTAVASPAVAGAQIAAPPARPQAGAAAIAAQRALPTLSVHDLTPGDSAPADAAPAAAPTLTHTAEDIPAARPAPPPKAGRAGAGRPMPRPQILQALYPDAGPALFLSPAAEAPQTPRAPALGAGARQALTLATRALNAELAGDSAADELRRAAEQMSRTRQRQIVASVAESIENDEGLGLKSLEYTFTPHPHAAPDWSVVGIRPLDGGAARDRATFVQFGAARTPASGTTWNAGLVHRQILPGGTWMAGGNLFYDYAPRYGHRRAGMGIDIMSEGFRLSANRYLARTDWRPGRPRYEERALSGQDIEVAGRLPGAPALQLTGRAWHFTTEEGPDLHGDEFGMEFRPSGLMTLKISSRSNGDMQRETVATLQLSYQLGVPLARQTAVPGIAPRVLADRLYEKVHRENEIRIEERLIDIIAPAGYTLAFEAGEIVEDNMRAVSLVLAAAEVGAHYSFEIVNTAAPLHRIIGAGQVVAAQQRLPAIDVSTLADGPLEARIVLTDRAGNAGLPAVARINKTTPAPAGVALAAKAPAVNMANQADFGFDLEAGSAWTAFTYRVRQEDGSLVGASGSGKVVDGIVSVDSIDLATLPDGVLSFEIELAGSANAATNALLTFKVVKDVVAPKVTSIEPPEVSGNAGA